MKVVQKLRGKALQNGYTLLDNGEAALIWMSAGNSYFTEEIVQHIVQFAAETFSTIIVMAPDGPAEYTFRGIGYEGNDVIKKARLNANLLQNRAKRAIESLPQKLRKKIHLIEWKEEIEPNSLFQQEYQKMIKLYEKNPAFREEALATTAKVIQARLKPEIELKKATPIAVHYLLQELAFISISMKLYHVNSIAYLYHKRWPIFERWIKGEFDENSKDNIGFIVLKE